MLGLKTVLASVGDKGMANGVVVSGTTWSDIFLPFFEATGGEGGEDPLSESFLLLDLTDSPEPDFLFLLREQLLASASVLSNFFKRPIIFFCLPL